MITGVVNAKLDATVRLAVKDASGREQEFLFVIDTGFSGSLTLPPPVIRNLGISWRTRGSAVLANGTVDHFDIYAATVLWDGTARNVLIEEADTEPLLGMGLLRGHDLSMRIVPGGNVAITTSA